MQVSKLKNLVIDKVPIFTDCRKCIKFFLMLGNYNCPHTAGKQTNYLLFFRNKLYFSILAIDFIPKLTINCPYIAEMYIFYVTKVTQTPLLLILSKHCNTDEKKKTLVLGLGSIIFPALLKCRNIALLFMEVNQINDHGHL